MVLGCNENKEIYAINLLFCDDFLSCTTIVINSKSGLRTKKCQPIGISLEKPCFSNWSEADKGGNLADYQRCNQLCDQTNSYLTLKLVLFFGELQQFYALI